MSHSTLEVPRSNKVQTTKYSSPHILPDATLLDAARHTVVAGYCTDYCTAAPQHRSIMCRAARQRPATLTVHKTHAHSHTDQEPRRAAASTRGEYLLRLLRAYTAVCRPYANARRESERDSHAQVQQRRRERHVHRRVPRLCCVRVERQVELRRLRGVSADRLRQGSTAVTGRFPGSLSAVVARFC